MTGALAVAGTGVLVAATTTAASAGTLEISPVTQNDTTGTQAQVCAEAIYSSGDQAVGAEITYVIQNGGPDSGTFTGTGCFLYTNNGSTGTDTIVASWEDNANGGTLVEAIAHVTWVAPTTPPPPPPTPPSIATSGPSNGATYDYGTVPAITYTCASTDGTSITSCSGFDPNYGNVPSGTQDGAGSGVAPGNYSVTITADDSNGLSSTDIVSYTVIPAPTTLTYTGATTARWDDSFTASGRLTDNVNGNAVSGGIVTFSLGADSCTATTDGSGVASCSIHVTLASGLYPANANYPVSDNYSGNEYYSGSSGGSTFTVTHQLDSLSYTGDTTARYDDPFTASGVLTDTGNNTPVSGRSVTFTLGGTDACTATTNSSGVASCSIHETLASGPWPASVNYPITDTFAGDDYFEAASAAAIFTVTHQLDSLTYTGATEVANGYPATLSGTLLETGILGIKPIDGRTVTFTLGSGATAQSCSGTTDASGNATCSLADVAQPDSPPLFKPALSVTFAGDNYFVPNSVNRTVDLLYYTGRSYAAFISDLLPAVPDTGAITTAQWVDPTDNVLNIINPVLSLNLLSAQVQTGHKASVATASIAGASIGAEFVTTLGVPELIPSIQVGVVKAQSTTTCAGSNGSSTIASLVIGGVAVATANTNKPNTTLKIGLLTVVLNQQIPIPGGLTVNAISITSPLLGISIVLGSATSDIHNCT